MKVSPARIGIVAMAATLSIGLLSAASIADHHKHDDAKKGDDKKTTVVDVAASNEQFSTLVTAVKAAGLAETLESEGPFTVFAPTNAAFEKLDEGVLESLLEPENKALLQQVLTYHVVPTRAMAEDVVKLDSVNTVQGSAVSIKVTDKGVMLNDNVAVTKTDIKADNGVIHVIDTVLLPPSGE
ncbi:MAG: fasciclin domain-containing protein [Phycisphaeraceae bacterium]